MVNIFTASAFNKFMSTADASSTLTLFLLINEAKYDPIITLAPPNTDETLSFTPNTVSITTDKTLTAIS